MLAFQDSIPHLLCGERTRWRRGGVKTNPMVRGWCNPGRSCTWRDSGHDTWWQGIQGLGIYVRSISEIIWGLVLRMTKDVWRTGGFDGCLMPLRWWSGRAWDWLSGFIRGPWLLSALWSGFPPRSKTSWEKYINVTQGMTRWMASALTYHSVLVRLSADGADRAGDVEVPRYHWWEPYPTLRGLLPGCWSSRRSCWEIHSWISWHYAYEKCQYRSVWSISTYQVSNTPIWTPL